VRLLHRLRKQFIGAVDLDLEMLALMRDALVVKKIHQHRQRLFLDIAPAFKIDTEAVEFIFAIAGTETELKPAVAQNVDES
jgi:hypothetical protein